MSSANGSNKTEQAERRAAKAGLVYVNSLEDGILRRRCGKGFTYKTSSGRTIKKDNVRKRIDALVIPPAWEDVLICTKPNGHIQAVGIDEAGRRQYIYHERWTAISTANKFDRMRLFGQQLPKIRRRILKDLNEKGLTQQRVLAAVVRLLDKAHLRVGNRASTDSNGSHGATTLLREHVEIAATRVSLNFPGKSGQQREVQLNDAKVAKVVRGCEDIGGQFLFQYLDDDEAHSIDSGEVNQYLHEISGEEFTAKDFRTWWGSTIALAELSSVSKNDSQAERKRKLSAALAATAKVLGNTKAVCRSSYVHPGLLMACESGELPKLLSKLRVKGRRNMTIDETRFLALLPQLECM